MYSHRTIVCPVIGKSEDVPLLLIEKNDLVAQLVDDCCNVGSLYKCQSSNLCDRENDLDAQLVDVCCKAQSEEDVQTCTRPQIARSFAI